MNLRNQYTKGPWYETHGPAIGGPFGVYCRRTVTFSRSNPQTRRQHPAVAKLTAQSVLVRNDLSVAFGGSWIVNRDLWASGVDYWASVLGKLLRSYFNSFNH